MGSAAPLVRSSQPVAVIVVENPDEALPRRFTPSDQLAAHVLADWIELMSGVRLPLVAEVPEDADVTRILIGAKAVEAGLELEGFENLSREGLRVESDGSKTILIAGQNGTSTVRAVARFLEEAFGCAFLWDHPLGRVHPVGQSDLVAPELSLREEPTLEYRRIWGSQWAGGNLWKIWNGAGGNHFPMAHSWGWFNEEDFEANPDWFRMDEEGNRIYGPWLNFGNDELRREFIRRALDRWDGESNLSMSPPDDHRVDYSPEARRFDDPVELDPSTGRISMTNRFLGIVNEVAREVYARNPEARISFYAYSDYTLPPSNPEVRDMPPNIAIWIAPIRYSRYHPIGHPNSTSMQQLQEMIEGWAEVAPMLGWRPYNLNLAEAMTPFSRLGSWKHDLPWLYERGLVGVSFETLPAQELMGPHIWQSIRLGYDPTQDSDELMEFYFDRLYGPAAEYVKAYWMEIDDAWTNAETEAGSIHVLQHIWTPERLALLDQYLRKAEAAAADHPMIAQRVAVDRLGWHYAHYWREMTTLFEQGRPVEGLEVFREWGKQIDDSIERRLGAPYTKHYHGRFLGGHLDPERRNRQMLAIMYPPNRILEVLSDEMAFSYDRDLEAGFVTPDHRVVGREATATEQAPAGQPFDPGYDDSSWPRVVTFSDTLNGQGYPDEIGKMWYRTQIDVPEDHGKLSLHFLKVDQLVNVYINGELVNEEPVRGFNGATVEITDHVRPGTNQVTFLVERIVLPELFLGGIVRPIYLIEHVEEGGVAGE